MANWVKNSYKIDKIISSPLKRASQTASFLSDATGIPVENDDDLMEFQNGLIAGLSREEAYMRYPKPRVVFPHTNVYISTGDTGIHSWYIDGEKRVVKFSNSTKHLDM